jgi:hypothetical protein
MFSLSDEEGSVNASPLNDHILRSLELLGRDIGVDVDGGILIIPFDDLYECFVSPARENDRVVMEVALMVIPQQSRGAAVRWALTLNAEPARTANGALFLDRESSVLMLRTYATVAADGAEGLGNVAATLITAARDLLRQLVGVVSAAPEERPRPEPADVIIAA